MHFNEKIGTDVITIMPIIAVSPDSYIRLTFEAFMKITFVHLISGLDEGKPELLQKGAISTEITGYTEWVSETTPIISVGWDWMIRPTQKKDAYYKRISEPRSNLMLIDSQKRDFGPARTTIQIETVIDEMAWQNKTYQYISARYTS